MLIKSDDNISYRVSTFAAHSSRVMVVDRDIMQFIASFINNHNFTDQTTFKDSGKTRGETITTTYGRIVINKCLPESYPFVNEAFTIKKINKILDEIVNSYGVDNKTFEETVFLLQKYGFIVSGLIGSSLDIKSFILPKEFQDKKNKLINAYESKELDAFAYDEEMTKLAKEYVEYMDKNNIDLGIFVNHGKGKVGDVKNALFARTVTVNSAGEITDVVHNSLIEGVSTESYFKRGSESIQALYAKTNEVARPGYIYRRLINLGSNLQISENQDCGTTEYFNLMVEDDNLAKAIIHRYYMDGNNAKLITKDNYKDLIGQTIKLRSPLFCKESKNRLCRTCYGDMYKALEDGSHVIMIAAANLASVLTNASLKKSHAGITLNMERVNLEKEFAKSI